MGKIIIEKEWNSSLKIIREIYSQYLRKTFPHTNTDRREWRIVYNKKSFKAFILFLVHNASNFPFPIFIFSRTPSLKKKKSEVATPFPTNILNNIFLCSILFIFLLCCRLRGREWIKLTFCECQPTTNWINVFSSPEFSRRQGCESRWRWPGSDPRKQRRSGSEIFFVK